MYTSIDLKIGNSLVGGWFVGSERFVISESTGPRRGEGTSWIQVEFLAVDANLSLIDSGKRVPCYKIDSKAGVFSFFAPDYKPCADGYRTLVSKPIRLSANSGDSTHRPFSRVSIMEDHRSDSAPRDTFQDRVVQASVKAHLERTSRMLPSVPVNVGDKWDVIDTIDERVTDMPLYVRSAYEYKSSLKTAKGRLHRVAYHHIPASKKNSNNNTTLKIIESIGEYEFDDFLGRIVRRSERCRLSAASDGMKGDKPQDAGSLEGFFEIIDVLRASEKGDEGDHGDIPIP
jgi:hypothetical protein